MSALLLKADMCSALGNVRQGPKADTIRRIEAGNLTTCGARWRGSLDRPISLNATGTGAASQSAEIDATISFVATMALA